MADRKQSLFEWIMNFFLLKILVGIIVIGGSVAFVNWAFTALLAKTNLNNDLKNALPLFASAGIGLVTYIKLFRLYEKRQIDELSARFFIRDALSGFLIGAGLQGFIVLILFFTGNYSVQHLNRITILLPALSTSVAAGFVAELLILGVLFRYIENITGTITALIFFVILFAILHGGEGTTFLSVTSTAAQAGFLLPAAFIATRRLWLPIFLHFAWDFTEPGIFGGINPGNSIDKTLITSNIRGQEILTGGNFGPQNSIQGLFLCVIAGVILLWIAKKRGNFIKGSSLQKNAGKP